MDLNFKKTDYYYAATNKTNNITDQVKRAQKFKYGNVTFNQFKKTYTPKFWATRKIKALPSALWSGVVKSSYHLAKGIVLGIFTFGRRNKYVKSQFLHAIRDLQASFGWLVTLFNDRRGQFLVQESKFHQTCYNNFLASDKATLSKRKFTKLSPHQKTGNTIIAAIQGCKTRDEALKIINERRHEAKSSKLVASAALKIDPTLIALFPESIRRDEDLVHEALIQCKSPEQARDVITNAHLPATASMKVALALIKVDPTLFIHLDPVIKDDKELVLATLHGCKNKEQAYILIDSIDRNLLRNEEIALALIQIDIKLFKYQHRYCRRETVVYIAALKGCKNREQAEKICTKYRLSTFFSKELARAILDTDPTLFIHLHTNLRDNIKLVLYAINRSSKTTIDTIWKDIGPSAAMNPTVRATITEKYPDFFKNELTEEAIVTAMQACKNRDEALKIINQIGFHIKSSKSVASAALAIDPTLIALFPESIQSDEDLVHEALIHCKTPDQAKAVFHNAKSPANYSVKVGLAMLIIDFEMIKHFAFANTTYVAKLLNSCKNQELARKIIDKLESQVKSSKSVASVAFAIDPTLIALFPESIQRDEDLVHEALIHCKTPEQAKTVIHNSKSPANNSVKVAFALLNIDPTLLNELAGEIRNNIEIVLYAINGSTKTTIDTIWNAIGYMASINATVRAKITEKYPDFFKDPNKEKKFNNDDDFRNSSQKTSGSSTPKRPPPNTESSKWSEPEDLKGQNSEGAKLARKVLQAHDQSLKKATDVNLHYDDARMLLVKMLGLQPQSSGREITIAYRKCVLKLHPDKIALPSAHLAFKLLSSAYTLAQLQQASK